MKYRIFLFLLIPILFLACGGSGVQKPSAAGPAAAPSRTARVEKSPGTLEIAGTVRAADVADIASRFGGFVRQVNRRTGTRVRAGELLLVLDDRSLQAQSEKVGAAKEEVAQAVEEAQQHLAAAEAQKKLAANTFERISKLYESKSASLQEFEEAQSRNDAAQAGWKAAQDRLAQAESKLKQVTSDTQDVAASLSYQRITAPFDGLVTSVTADQGAFVQPGQKLMTVENTRRYQLVFSVGQELLPALAQGSQVDVIVPAAGPAPLKGTVSEVNGTSDASTSTFTVKADLPQATSFQTGWTGRAVLSTPSRSSLWIPEEFLTRRNDIETVMVRADNEWRRVLVKSGDTEGNRVEILAGLNEGDEVGLFGEEQ